MSWLRIEDRFAGHPKVAQLNDRQFRIHVRAMCYCAAQRTDGFVPKGTLPELGARAADAASCVRAGVWEPIGGGWLIHDFLVYNPSKEEQDAQDAARTDRARKAARTRWDARPDASSNASGMPLALLDECSGNAPTPPASEKTPLTPRSAGGTPTNPRALGTNPRGPKPLTAAEQWRADNQAAS